MSVPKVDALRILSLDGGDLNCISQLKILEEFMKRLENDSDAGEAMRPCEYFHSITGVGASGVIAILLGVLGLSVDDTSAAFIRFCDEVSLGQDLDRNLRSAKLVAATKVLLQGINVSEESKLRGDLNRADGCKVSIPYMSASDMTHCRIMRSYESGHSSHNPTIIEAIRIAWANPDLFSPLRIGPEYMQEELVSAVDGCSNPTLQAIEEAYNAFGKDQKVACILSLGNGKPGYRSLSTDSVQLAKMIARDTESTAEQLERRYFGLQIYFRLSVDRTLELGTASRTIQQRAGRITSYTSTYLETHTISETLERCVRRSRSARYITMESLYRSRASGSRSSLGLPPLSAFFVPRKRHMSQITAALSMRDPGSPAIGLLIGLSGTGKTQISLKYAYDHDDEYDHIIFVDASSTESLEKSLIARIQLIDRQLNPSNAESAVNLLANPEGILTTKWLLIMDNADNSNVILQEFIPRCDHGCVLVTSRNAALSDLNPDGYIPVDAMSREEAVEALLSAALGTKTVKTSESSKPTTARMRSVPRTKEDYECAVEIVEELGCLPLAVIQAACYIKRQKCLHEYPTLLKTSRDEILRWPASVQRDTLKYAHSTYAAFDTTLSVLTHDALELLGIISFFNFSDFPKPLIQLAASLQFDYQENDLLDRPPEYQQTLDLLRRMFCRGGYWSPIRLDSILEQLQSLSLVSLVPVSTVVTLRFHPLLHGWANDRLSTSDRVLFRSAAIRLLACGIRPDDDYLLNFLYPHVERFLATSNELHVNDKAALAVLLRSNGQLGKAFDLWKSIHATVEGVHGEKHLRTTRVAMHLADAYGNQGDWQRMESIERKVVDIRKETLGEANMETLYAMANLARTWRICGERYDEALELESEVLRMRRELCGPRHRQIVHALADLAATNTRKGDHAQAQILLTEALEMITALVGRTHVARVRVMELLAPCYARNQHTSESIALEQEIMGLWQKIRGNRHATTLEAMAKLAKSYSEQAQYKEAEKLWRDLADAREETLGKQHYQTLEALYSLGTSLFNQPRYPDAAEVWRDLVNRRREVSGDQHSTTLLAISYLARSIHEQERYAEAGVFWRELLAGREATVGRLHSDTFNALYWVVVGAYKQGHYAEAESLGRGWVEGRRETLGAGDAATLTAVYWLAAAIHQQERYTEAEVLWKEATMGRRSVLGENHTDTLNSLYWWCLSIEKQKRYADAEVLYRELVAGYRITFGEQNEKTLQALSSLARSIYEQGRYPDAEILWSEAVAGRQATVGKHHEETLASLYWLARSIYEQKRYSNAETLWSETVAGRRATVGDRHGETLACLYWLGRSIYDQKRYSDAETLWREAVAGRRATVGDHHGETLACLYWLGRSIYDQERYSDAETLWSETVAGRRATVGDHHGETLASLYWLARSIYEQKRYSNAETLWSETVAGRRATVGDHHGETLACLYWLGRSIYEQKRYSNAETLWSETVAGRRATVGDRHGETLTCLYWLGRSIYEQERYYDAEILWREAVAGRRATVGDHREETLSCLYWLGRSVYEQKRYPDAETLWSEVVAGRRATVGDHHGETLACLYWLGRSVYEQKRYPDAETLWGEAVAGRRATEGNHHGETLACLYWLGRSIYDQERYPVAETLWREALAGRRATVGDHHTETVALVYWVARAVYDQERYPEAETLLREAVAERRPTLGDKHKDTLTTLYWLSKSIFGQQKYAEAERMWEEVVEGRREILGAENADTLDAKEWLIRTQRALNTEVSPANPSTEGGKVEDNPPDDQPGPRPEREDTSIASNEPESDLGTEIPAQIPVAEGH